ELMDSAYLWNKYGRPIYHDGWMEITRNLQWLIDHWDQPDEGIWETRGGRRNYTYSRLMSWVAVERAIRIAHQRGLPADLSRWMAVRDRIYSQIIQRGWHSARGAFVQHYDTDVLDASLLLMPLCKFIAPHDPRWISTLDAITAELVSDSLVYRYNLDASPDGLTGEEATFSLCSFWWVEALARAGRLDEARLALEEMLTYANHVGLYSEEIGPTGEQLGNFPQAFTHLALISAAYNLDRFLGRLGMSRTINEANGRRADAFVSFGITSDLAKVMPFRSLYRLESRGLLDCPIVGVARRDWTTPQLRKYARECIEGTGEQIDDAIFDDLAGRLSYLQGDIGDADTYRRLAEVVGGPKSPVFYLQTAPSFFANVIKGL